MRNVLLCLISLALILSIQPAFAQTFDNSGGGGWEECMSFPITTTPTEYAQYKITISGTTWELYNVNGSLEASGVNGNFWSSVNSTGADIRVFDQNYNQLYFWVENLDYANQTAIIWVNLTAGSTELNIAYGNPSATKSTYDDPEKVFELYDDFEGSAGSAPDPNKWEDHKMGSTNAIVELDGSGNLHLAGEPNVVSSGNVKSLKTFTNNFVIELKHMIQEDEHYADLSIGNGSIIQDVVSGGTSGWQHTTLGDGYMFDWNTPVSASAPNDVLILVTPAGQAGTVLASYQTDAPITALNEWHTLKYIYKSDGTLEWYHDGTLLLSVTNTSYLNDPKNILISQGEYSDGKGGHRYIDWVRVYKLDDPADFGTPIVKHFQERFGTKSVYVNVTYLDTGTTSRFNPTAYYKLKDKPQINVTSSLSVTGVNATYGANISIELIDFVTLDKVVYNGTDVTVSLTYQGTITNATTGHVYNVYNFTTYENGTLEIYGHVSNKAYETTYKLDGELVDIFNTTAIIGESLEIILPHKGNVTIASVEHIGVTSALVNTKDLGTGAKTLTITIEDPENFTVGYRYGTVIIDWGKVYFNITDLQNKTLAGTTYGFFNKNFSILSTDPTKLYAGDIEIDVYFHGVELKSLEIYLNHTNNGLTLNVSVNATQFKDYRNVTRIIASPNYFEVVNLSAKYPFSVMKLVNASGTIVIDFVSNAPTSVKVEGATSYTYEKPVLKITANSNVTITDFYKLTVPLKDRLGNKVNFYILINGSRVDASAGKASKLLKPSWYEVKVPITVSGFELWKFNDSSNIALVEINASDKTLPTAEYRVPSKIVTKEVRIQTKFPWLPFPFPFLSESKPAQEETPIVRLQGSLRDFYNAPVPNKTIVIKVASPNFTRVYNVTTDSSGNFKIDVDMAEGIEYKVSYKFAGDDVYVSSSTTKTFTIEQLLPAPPEEITIEEILIFVGMAVGLVAVVAGAIYLARRTKAKTLARMESEFRFFRRLK